MRWNDVIDFPTPPRIDAIAADGDRFVTAEWTATENVLKIYSVPSDPWDYDTMILDATIPLDAGYMQVAVDGDTIAVSLFDWFDDAAIIQIYGLSAGVWSLSQTIPFGAQHPGPLSLDGDTLVAGRVDEDVWPTYIRSVSFFERSNGLFALATSFTSSESYFGASVAVEGNTALVGSGPEHNVHVFNKVAGSWVEGASISPPGAALGFGYAVAISGDRAVIGKATGWLDDPGEAFVFLRGAGGWALESALPVPGLSSTAHYGSSVDIKGDLVIVGARGHDSPSTDRGAAWLWERSGGSWQLFASPMADWGLDHNGKQVALGAHAYILNDARAVGFALDVDDDHISDLLEPALGLDPNDPDTDDDGLLDGLEGQCHPTDPDADDDGLLDGAEKALGTGCQDPDSDDDGLLDGAEVNTYGTDPLDSDSDNDGLSDGAEVNTHNTDPLDSDSDDDGLSDGAEVNTYGSDPLDADTDNDGLHDGAEVTHGSDIFDPDTDDDGLSDGAEVNTYGTDPTEEDTDGDGQRDGYEVTNGSDPNDDTSVMMPSGPTMLPAPLGYPVPEW